MNETPDEPPGVLLGSIRGPIGVPLPLGLRCWPAATDNGIGCPDEARRGTERRCRPREADRERAARPPPPGFSSSLDPKDDSHECLADDLRTAGSGLASRKPRPRRAPSRDPASEQGHRPVRLRSARLKAAGCSIDPNDANLLLWMRPPSDGRLIAQYHRGTLRCRRGGRVHPSAKPSVPENQER